MQGESPAERARYRKWWLEDSGLTRDEVLKPASHTRNFVPDFVLAWRDMRALTSPSTAW